MGTGTTGGTPTIHTFKLARLAHGQRNLMDTNEEVQLQEEAQERREVCMPGLDIATAWALVRTGGKILVRRRYADTGLVDEPLIHMKTMTGTDLPFVAMNNGYALNTSRTPEELQVGADTARVSAGFCIFIHESWSKLSHLVRYFDMVEKNEAPDTPLLEWLIMVGAVSTEAAKKTIEHFRTVTRVGRTVFTLDAEDLMRLGVAVDVRLQLEAEEEAARRLAAAEDRKSAS